MAASMEMFADDEEVPVVEYRATEVPVVVPSELLQGLREEAVSAQRLVVSRLAREYVGGGMLTAVAEYGRKLTPEKMFNINKLVEWVEGEPEIIIEALDAGRLRCRLSAAMGLGKSTKLASYVARVMDYRVLHVALDAHALQQNAIYIRAHGLGKISRRWTAQKKSHVCCMTYSDFNGYMNTARRVELFRAFDLIIFDEAIVATDDVFVAKKCFSVYAPAETNLILCSATIRTDITADSAGSKGMGSYRELSMDVSLDDAIKSGKLVADYLVDRTMVVLPTNDLIQQAYRHYEDNGVDVRVLDDADSYEVLRDVVDWLGGDATVPRVLIVHYSYAISYNIPVAYGIIWPYTSGMICRDDVVEEVVIPMTEDMVVQAKARTGRGIVAGSGGVIMSSVRGDVLELPETEKMSAFVKLCAAAIKPLRTTFWESCYAKFPEALTVSAALTILKVCMPVEVVAKYLGSDGRVASRYCRALNAFAHPDHFLLSSDDEMPSSYDYWVSDHIGFGDSAADGYEQIKVPFKASGELKVIISAVEMMAQMRMDIPRWRPTRGFAMGDAYDSEEESSDSRFQANFIKLRRIDDIPRRVISAPVEVKRIPWTYRPVEGTRASRSGGYIDSVRCKEALIELEKSLLEYAVSHSKLEEVIEVDEGTVVPVVVDGMGDVESPGGSIVCSLPVKLCEKMNLGQVVRSDEFLRLASAARVDVDRFVASKLFDCFSGPWESILRSLLEDSVVHDVVRSGVAADVYMMVDRMRSRFSLELISVLAKSNIFQKRFLKVFSRQPTMDETMKAIRKGKFDGIAQTDGFIRRVKLLKRLIDEVLLSAERENVYLPTYITNAQRILPLRGSSSLGYVEEDVHRMPDRTVKKLHGMILDHKASATFDGDRAGW